MRCTRILTLVDLFSIRIRVSWGIKNTHVLACIPPVLFCPLEHLLFFWTAWLGLLAVRCQEFSVNHGRYEHFTTAIYTKRVGVLGAMGAVCVLYHRSVVEVDVTFLNHTLWLGSA